MKLLLQRTHASGGASGRERTFGKLFADGAFVCYTLEDCVREVRGAEVGDWKIKGSTAIPSTEHVGRPYFVGLEYSPRFGADTATIYAVPGFVGVRMHAGNTEADTEGCPLLGMAIDASGIVGGTSRPAVALLKALLQKAQRESTSVLLTISNMTELA